jgi:hypothetical protein
LRPSAGDTRLPSLIPRSTTSYLMCLHQANKRSATSLGKSIEYFQKQTQF